jgi:molecular chaperone Hsp33
MSPAEDSAVNVACRFVRGRNALLCAADFGPVFMDFYLHLGQTGVVLARGMDEWLKTLFAALTLHAAAQPRTLTCAWTVHLEEAGVNLFAVADNAAGLVTGQAFGRDVRAVGGNVLHAETAGPAGLRRRSSVPFQRADLLEAATAYYAASEQRAARYFALGGDSFALLAAQPDADLDWLQSVGLGEIERLVADSGPPLETRVYRFGCGCTPGKIAAAIAPALRGDLDGVFGGDTHIRVSCPRCGMQHELEKSQLTS